jgi:streptogramin lyase
MLRRPLERFSMRRIAALTSTIWIAAVTAAAGDPVVTAGGALDAAGTGIATGFDGSLWHTSGGKAPAVGRTTLTGHTVSFPLPDAKAEPGAIARGPDYALWFVDERGAIMRVDAMGAIDTVREVKGSPQSLALGGDGNMWFTLAGKDPAIGRVDPTDGLTFFDAGLGAAPADIAGGPDGALWFTEPRADRVGRIDIFGTITEYAVGDQPGAIAAGIDGGMWFTQRGAIGRIDPSGTVTAFSAGLPESWQPADLALGFDASLWFTSKRGVGQITPAGAITTFPTTGLRPGAIAVGGDGGMWFTDTRLPVLGRIGSLPVVAPVPVLSKTFVARAVRGDVSVRKPGFRRFVPLGQTASIPVGSVVDATNGRIRLRSALAGGKGTQGGTFYGGRFVVRQPRGKRGLVRLELRGRLSCRAAGSTATASRKHRRRRVWGIDLGGLFQTLGLDSITTVRGTKWLTEDRCGGTLTRVKEGSVVVRERATGKRVVVRAGESYLARRRP